jgi:hypothetical protein
MAEANTQRLLRSSVASLQVTRGDVDAPRAANNFQRTFKYVVDNVGASGLPLRERQQFRAHRFVRSDVAVRAAFAELGGVPLQVGPLDRTPTEGVLGQVDERTAGISVERLRLPQVVQSADETKERLLHEILGEGPVSR